MSFAVQKFVMHNYRGKVSISIPLITMQKKSIEKLNAIYL